MCGKTALTCVHYGEWLPFSKWQLLFHDHRYCSNQTLLVWIFMRVLWLVCGVRVLMLFHSIIWVCWNLYFNLRNQPATINLFLTPNFRPICMKNIVYPTRIIRYNDHHLWFLLLNIIYMVLQCTLKCYADHIYFVRLIWYKSKCNCWINLEGDILFMRWCIMLKMKTTQEML